MATVIADNIISPLGRTTEENLEKMLSGVGSLRRYESAPGVPFPFTASLFSNDEGPQAVRDGFTPFESLAIASIESALTQCNVPKDARTALIISTTKGNVGELKQTGNDSNVESLGASVGKISENLPINCDPVAVSNACISGVSALVLGQRLVDSGEYDFAVVCGIDVQSPFIISGFQSLKAMSDSKCRPFDIERLGLNLGEGAATIILQSDKAKQQNRWKVLKGAVRNDAFHITNPSPKGEGSRLAIESTIGGIDTSELALINAHGTATMFNDQMESKAIAGAGLSETPVNALKGYIGHTMGAAGVIETILSMKALDRGTIIGSEGFEELGVSGKVDIVQENRHTDKSDLLKIISGFGGANAAVYLSKSASASDYSEPELLTTHQIEITPDSASIDGKKLPLDEFTDNIITGLYKTRINDYPKFYKMDGLARLGFVATDLLLQTERESKPETADKDFGESRGILFFNRNSSVHADKRYLESICNPENYYPSPSLFVYTLPNIVTGEIAIRNHYQGECCFYVLPEENPEQIAALVKSAFLDSKTESVVTGWVEYDHEHSFSAQLSIVERRK